jgi:hypothetical protein
MKFYFLALGTLVLVCAGCAYDGSHILDHGVEKGVYNAPPAEMMMRPGPMVDGPGPGVMPMLANPAVPAMMLKSTELRFVGPSAMQIGWQIPNGFAENQVIAPARQSFQQGATYRLKCTSIAGREGMTIYPTLQVYPSTPYTDAFLAHSDVPMDITDEDLDQVESNNFVTKVIYLPDARYQELAIAGVETLVSTRLDPGVDPVAEADRRGTILAVLRMGNRDLEQPGAPGMAGRNGLNQVSYNVLDGGKGQHVEPMPIHSMEAGLSAVPAPMIVAGSGAPGMPAVGPISGVGGAPVYGQPITGTPIGLAGPPHLPYGGPAGLKSHTMRNVSHNNLPKPVQHMLVDVEHKPGYSVPPPVKYVKYTEEHPVYGEGEVSYPQWAQGGAAGAGPGGQMACPPQQ